MMTIVFKIMIPNHELFIAVMVAITAGARAVDLGGPSVYQGGPKFEIKDKSRSFQKSKLVNWGGKHVDWEGLAPLGAGPGCYDLP